MKFLRKIGYFESVIFAALVAAIAWAMATPKADAQVQCQPADIAVTLTEIHAVSVGGKTELLTDSGEVARYLAVLNEEPPTLDHADAILIFIPPDAREIDVIPIRRNLICFAFGVTPQFHAKAWRAAKGGAV